MGPLPGDNLLTGDWSSYVDSNDPFLLQKPRTPKELTGDESNLEVELETARELVQHVRSWMAKIRNVRISDTFVNPNNVQGFVMDLKSLFETSSMSPFLQQGIDAAGSVPPSRQGSIAPGNAEMSTPTGPTTPPCSGQSADTDVSMTPKASAWKPADPPQPQGSGSGPLGSGLKSGGPSRADKGKQPVRTNPVAVQPWPQPKKPMVPFQRMGMPPPINRATKPKKSYASVAKSTPNTPVTVAQLAKVAPNLPVDRIAQANSTVRQKKSSCKRKTVLPNFTTLGPSRRQILISFNNKKIACDFNLFVKQAQAALASTELNLRILSMADAYGGYTVYTEEVPHPNTINVICGLAVSSFQTDALYVGLPTSTSYIKIMDVPYYQNVAKCKPVTVDTIKEALGSSPLSVHFVLARNPRINHNSASSTTATVYCDLWDSQTGAHAKALIGRTIMIGRYLCMIREADKHRGVPVCQRCW